MIVFFKQLLLGEAQELVLIQRRHYFYGAPEETRALQQLPIHPEVPGELCTASKY